METVWDRAARRMRPLIFIVAVLSLPVFFLSYGRMLIDAMTAWPLWVSIPTIISHVMIFIGAACLHDHQQEQRQFSQEKPRH